MAAENAVPQQTEIPIPPAGSTAAPVEEKRGAEVPDDPRPTAPPPPAESATPRRRGRPPGAKNKPKAPAPTDDDPLAGTPAPPPRQRADARRVVEPTAVPGKDDPDDEAGDEEAGDDDGKEPLGEEGAREVLPLAFMILNGLGMGVAWLYCRDFPGILEQAKAIMCLTEEEQKQLERPLLLQLARMRVSREDMMMYAFFSVYAAKGVQLRGLKEQAAAERKATGNAEAKK